jgi:heme exporter protein C
LHQPASLVRRGGPTIALPMLLPLLVMALAFALLFATLLLLRMQTLLIERKALTIRLNIAPARGSPAPPERGMPLPYGAHPGARGDGR